MSTKFERSTLSLDLYIDKFCDTYNTDTDYYVECIDSFRKEQEEHWIKQYDMDSVYEYFVRNDNICFDNDQGKVEQAEKCIEDYMSFELKDENYVKISDLYDCVDLVNNVVNSDDCEYEIEIVERFEYEGVTYLRSKYSGLIYSPDDLENPTVVGIWDTVTERIDFEYVETLVEAVVDYESDDDDEELDRIIAEAQRKKELKRLKKLQENKAEEWEEKKAPLIVDAIHNDMKKIVDFAKKNNIPLTLLSMGDDLMFVNANAVYQSYEPEQLETDYARVKETFFTPGAPKKVNTNTNRVRITNRAPPTKRVRESRLLFQDREVVEHIATEKNTRAPLNRITAEFRLDINKWCIITDEHNTMVGKIVRNLNQFIIANNEIYAPEKVQKETAWAGSVKVNRDDVWISVGNINPL